MTRKDIALSDISRWQVRTYNALLSTEYWGWHVWGLGVAKGGRFLYMMRPNSPIRGRGVQLQLASGERVLIGSERPEELQMLSPRLRAQAGSRRACRDRSRPIGGGRFFDPTALPLGECAIRGRARPRGQHRQAADQLGLPRSRSDAAKGPATPWARALLLALIHRSAWKVDSA